MHFLSLQKFLFLNTVFKPASIIFRYIQFTQFDIHKALIERKLKNISSLFFGTWLDVGAGNSPYKKHFSSCEKYLTTNTRRHYSDEKIIEIDKLTTFWIEDGTSLPLENEAIDGLACFQVLSVIGKPELFFKEANRVLKPEGYIVLTTDFLYPVWSNEDVMRHTAFHIEQLAIQNGFEILQKESFGGFFSTIYALFSRYLRSFPGILKSSNIFQKIINGFFYFIVLLFLPIISLKGFVIFMLEKNITHRTDYTFNLWMVARKK